MNKQIPKDVAETIFYGVENMKPRLTWTPVGGESQVCHF